MNERINMNEKTKKEGKKDCGSETGLKYIKSPTTQNYKNNRKYVKIRSYITYIAIKKDK